MAEPIQLMFSHQELAEILIKKSGIHDGTWSIAIEFKMGAATIGPDEANIMPSGVISVSRIGIQESPRENPLSVDAAIVNPKPKPKPKVAPR